MAITAHRRQQGRNRVKFKYKHIYIYIAKATLILNSAFFCSTIFFQPSIRC